MIRELEHLSQENKGERTGAAYPGEGKTLERPCITLQYLKGTTRGERLFIME